MCQEPGAVGPSPATPTPGSNCTGPQPGRGPTSPPKTVSCGGSCWHLGQAFELGVHRVPIRQPSSHTSTVQRFTQDSQLMHLLRCLFFLEAYFSFQHHTRHHTGKEKPKEPTPIPLTLEELLLDLSLSCTSPHWKNLFRATLSEVLPAPPQNSICLQKPLPYLLCTVWPAPSPSH